MFSAPQLPVAMSSITSLDLVNLQTHNSTLLLSQGCLVLPGAAQTPAQHPHLPRAGMQICSWDRGSFHRRSSSREEQGAANHSSLASMDHEEEPETEQPEWIPQTQTPGSAAPRARRWGQVERAATLLKVNSHCSGGRRASCPPPAWDKPTNKSTNKQTN